MQQTLFTLDLIFKKTSKMMFYINQLSVNKISLLQFEYACDITTVG